MAVILTLVSPCRSRFLTMEVNGLGALAYGRLLDPARAGLKDTALGQKARAGQFERL